MNITKINLAKSLFFNSLVSVIGLVYVGVMVWSIIREDRRKTEKHEREMMEIPVNKS